MNHRGPKRLPIVAAVLALAAAPAAGQVTEPMVPSPELPKPMIDPLVTGIDRPASTELQFRQLVELLDRADHTIDVGPPGMAASLVHDLATRLVDLDDEIDDVAMAELQSSAVRALRALPDQPEVARAELAELRQAMAPMAALPEETVTDELVED